MESKLITLFDYVKNLGEQDLERIIEFVLSIVASATQKCNRPNCPHCDSTHIIKYGNRITKKKKQRFLCKDCGKTYMFSTNTIMQGSHFERSVWADFITDTITGCSLDESAEKYHFSHVTAFNMRHKVLMALEDLQIANPTILSGTTECDETFVLESQKGTKIPADAGRKPRRHGAKAQKSGISSEYIAICTGVQRDGQVIAESVNRAKPSACELKQIFEGHIADGTLILTDGLRSYNALKSVSDCTIMDVRTEDSNGFFNLNTVNSLHSYIKDTYIYYRGVATKYLNRYNALFAIAFRATKNLDKDLFSSFGDIGGLSCWHSVQATRTSRLLVI